MASLHWGHSWWGPPRTCTAGLFRQKDLTLCNLKLRCSDLNINTHCGSRLKWNVECFRCLFLIGPSRCIDSNCPRMKRLFMMWSLPSPGNMTTCHIFPFKPFYEKSSPVSSVFYTVLTELSGFKPNIRKCEKVVHSSFSVQLQHWKHWIILKGRKEDFNIFPFLVLSIY